MLIKTAKAITGGLSAPSKMPGRAYSTPAEFCKTGSKLALIPGTVCHGCYALNRGNYAWPNVKLALRRRYKSVMRAVDAERLFGAWAGAKYRERWIEAMVTLIKAQSPAYFRWHDSGDIQSVAHIELIAEVCRRTPQTKHWIPTREIGIIKRWIVNGGKIPDNLSVRISAHVIGETISLKDAPKGITISTVDSGSGYRCPAQNQGNSCGDCRACWDNNIPAVDYHKH